MLRAGPRMQLQIRNSQKTYPNGVRALRGVDLTIGAGMFGLLGPNGAGKSTLMRTLATLAGSRHRLRASSAPSTSWPTRSACASVLGYLPQEFGLYPNLSRRGDPRPLRGAEGHRSTAASAPLRSPPCSSRPTSPPPRKNGRGRLLRRHEAAARASPSPCSAGRSLVIVDEPTAGLDPTERHRFLNLLGRHRPGRGRHPEHPHRRGRARAVQPVRDHQPPARSSSAARRRRRSTGCAARSGAAW